MNAIGVWSTIFLLLASLGAAISYFALGIDKLISLGSGFGVWSDPKSRARFLVFLGFCVLGLISGLVGVWIGGAA